MYDIENLTKFKIKITSWMISELYNNYRKKTREALCKVGAGYETGGGYIVFESNYKLFIFKKWFWAELGIRIYYEYCVVRVTYNKVCIKYISFKF